MNKVQQQTWQLCFKNGNYVMIQCNSCCAKIIHATRSNHKVSNEVNEKDSKSTQHNTIPWNYEIYEMIVVVKNNTLRKKEKQKKGSNYNLCSALVIIQLWNYYYYCISNETL